MRNSLSDSHPFSKFIFSLFIILAAFLLIFIIGFLIAIPIFHININDLTNLLSDYNDPDNIRFLKYLQTIQAVGLFIVPAFIIGYLFHSKSSAYLQFKWVSKRNIILTVFIFLAAIPLINSFAVLNQNMQFPEWLNGLESWMQEKELSAQELTKAFLKMDSLGSLLFNIFMIGLLPAIGEELIFRGVLQRIFAEWTKNIHWGIVIAAILFSAMHMQFYGFLPRMILGVLLGYLFYWSGSIWIPMIGHFVNNTTAIILYYFYAEEMNRDIESFGAGQESIIYLIIGIAFVTPLLYLFYKENKKQITD
ncbi:lysostaphin resistance A-like protein [Bacteroidota bacterium]